MSSGAEPGLKDHMLQFDVFIQMQLYDTTLTEWMARVASETMARAQRRLAAAADEVILMVAGLQMRMKG